MHPTPLAPSGLALAKWRWLFDFQTPLVGVGLMAPLGVAWWAQQLLVLLLVLVPTPVVARALELHSPLSTRVTPPNLQTNIVCEFAAVGTHPHGPRRRPAALRPRPRPRACTRRSMVVGAGVSWGVLWPVLDGKAGDWFPAGLPAWNAQGLFGYQLVLAMGLLLADGLVTVVRGCITGGIALGGGRNGRRRAGGGGGGAAPGAAAAHAGAPRAARGASASGRRRRWRQWRRTR
jgi:hypothetical protein